MQRNQKFYQKKKLRQNLVDYLKEMRAKEGHADFWTPGNPSEFNVKKMIKAKIGSGNMLTKGARKWEAAKKKLSHKKERSQKHNIESYE
jgi:hypothetical protein